MFKNYLKIAIRNLLRQKSYSFINISGLAIGITSFLLLMLYIINDISYDRFHKNSDNIYRIATRGKIAGNIIEVATVPAPMGPKLVEDFPEVINSVRFRDSGESLFSYGTNKSFKSRLLYADNSLFEVFSFELIQGDPKTVLMAPYTIVISSKIAKKYFGNKNPIGKILKLNNNEEFNVAGVINDSPPNSHFTFDILASFETLYKRSPERMQWIGWNYHTYIQLHPGIDYNKFEAKFIEFNEKYLGKILKSLGAEVFNYLQPLTSIHLHSKLESELGVNSDIRYVYALGVIAIFILTIACINFINLSTARSINRAKEVGIRKVVGAKKTMIVKQFLGESFFLISISVFLALIIFVNILPYFNIFSGLHFSLNIIFHPWFITVLIVFTIFIGLISGSYPAFFLSSFKPVSVLKGILQKGTGKSQLRKFLVLVQFSISITLIIGTSIVFNQLNYMKNKRLGFNKEQLMVIPIKVKELKQKSALVKSELLNISGVLKTCGSMKVPGQSSFNTDAYFPEGFSDAQSFLMENFFIDEDFIETYGIELIEGRNFSELISTDQENAVLINETAVKELDWKNPIGKKIYSLTSSEDLSKRKTLTVIGVFKDIHHQSVHHLINPAMIDYSPNYANNITLKLNTQNISQTIEMINDKWNKIAPNHPFEYFFIDNFYNNLYRSEEKIGELFLIFTIIAIIIGCLGLFGLTTFTAEQKTKEIGIRKVLGSTTINIIFLLSKEFIKLIFIAFLIAIPFSYFTMNSWLQNFVYHTKIGFSLYIISFLLVLIITLLTIGYQSIRAAMANPVKALKYE